MEKNVATSQTPITDPDPGTCTTRARPRGALDAGAGLQLTALNRPAAPPWSSIHSARGR